MKVCLDPWFEETLLHPYGTLRVVNLLKSLKYLQTDGWVGNLNIKIFKFLVYLTVYNISLDIYLKPRAHVNTKCIKTHRLGLCMMSNVLIL